ncbi:MAG: hypothetical protein KIH89_000440 [Candidatus Shapirobacteria bacterium]|nr:hypothetical protein [Candidatus Shapirobacteria bacterium]
MGSIEIPYKLESYDKGLDSCESEFVVNVDGKELKEIKKGSVSERIDLSFFDESELDKVCIGENHNYVDYSERHGEY